MKVAVKNGLMYRESVAKENMMDCPEADSIANANGFHCAEQITKQFDGQTLCIDTETKKIYTIEEEFL